MQGAYIGKMMELAEKDANLLHLLADSGTGYDELFRRCFPDQIYNFGIGEQNMVAAAAGMAAVGKIPFVYTSGAFLAYRAFEFIRNDVCFQDLNVKIVGMGSGLAWSTLGPTHHTTEDVTVLRSLPNLVILSPATPKQVSECVELAYRHTGPVYIRIGMNKEKEFFGDGYHMTLSQNDIIRRGKDAVLYVTGSILEEAVTVAERLSDDGTELEIINVGTIKPFEADSVIRSAARFRHFFTLEEHNVLGGLAGIIAEVIAVHGLGVRLHPIGLNDVFADGYGTHKAIRKENALDSESVCRRIKEVLSHE